MSRYNDTQTGSDSDQSYVKCCKEPDDFCTLLAASLMLAGIVFMTVGYVVPRDYKFNPYAPAREMESIEIHFARLSYNLDIVITVGMSLVAAGGIIMAGVMCYAMYFDKNSDFIFGELDMSSDNKSFRPFYGSTDRQSNLRSNLFEMNSK